MDRGCFFTVTINGKEMVFNSDRELDTFLKENADSFKIDEIHKTFSMDAQTRSINILNNEIITPVTETVTEKVDMGSQDGDGFEVETAANAPLSIAVTRFLNYVGKRINWDEPISVPFDVELWKKHYVDKEVANGKERSVAMKEADLTVKSWDVQTEYGIEIHKIFESVITGEDYKSPKIDETQQEEIKTWFNGFITKFKRDFGEKSQFFTEVSIKSKALNPRIQKALKDVDFVNGRIDLLAIDERGNYHVFDFKISKRGVGVWEEMDNSRLGDYWHSTKKWNVSHQMGVYRAILEQYNVPVYKTQILPIKITPTYAEDGITITGINSIETPNDETLKNLTKVESRLRGVYDNVKSMFPAIGYREGNSTKLMSDVSAMQKALFPDNKGEEQQLDMDAEFNRIKNNRSGSKMWGTLNVDSSNYKNGLRYWFNEGNSNKPTAYAGTIEEIDNLIRKYIEKTTAESKSTYLRIAERVAEQINGNDVSLLDYVEGDPRELWLKGRFSKYINNGWTLHRDDDINAAGIFIFKKWNQCEIVALSNKTFLTENNLGSKSRPGHSILGAFIEDGRWDRAKVLPANNGNIAIMNVLNLVHLNPELFKGVRINMVMGLNYLQKRSTGMTYNEQLLDNYRTLFQYRKSEKSNGFDYEYDPSFEVYFANDYDSAMNIANGIYESGTQLQGLDMEGRVVDDLDAKLEAIDAMDDLLKKTRSQLYNKLNGNGVRLYDDHSSKEWEMYLWLQRAEKTLRGLKFYEEGDKRMYSMTQSLMTTSAELSPSINMMTQSQHAQQFKNEVIRAIDTDRTKIVKVFNKANNKLTPRIIGGAGSWWRNVFVKDSSGQIDERFMVIPPSNPFYNDKPEVKEAVTTFLEMVNEFRYESDWQREEDRLNSNSPYYEVPLMPARKIRQLKENLRRGDVSKVAANIVTNVKQRMNDIGDSWNFDPEQVQYDPEKLEVRNPFERLSNREKVIETSGVGYFETDLERVLEYYRAAYQRSRISKKYIGDFEGMIMLRGLSSLLGGTPTPNNDEAIKKYLQMAISHNPIMDPNMRQVDKLLANVRQLGSTLALSWNTVTFAREGLQSSIRNAVQAAGGPLRHLVDEKNIVKAMGIVAGDIKEQVGKISMMEHLIHSSGMYDSGLDSQADRMYSNKVGFLNINSDTGFIATRGIDFYSRGSILVARMLKEDCFKAHKYISEDEPCRYVFTDDPRYAIYWKGETTNPKYGEQKALYEERLDQFNREGEDLRIGDELPRAYTNVENMTLKNYADILFGHYDPETKALITQTFVGKMFFHMRSFALSIWERNTLPAGIYNLKELKQKVDPDGVKWVRIMKWDNEEKLGVPTVSEPMREDEANQQLDLNTMAKQPFMEWTGIPMEGVLQSMFKWGHAIATRDQQWLNEQWADPVKRGNLAVFLMDMPAMMLIGWLIQAMFGWDELKDKSWIQNWGAQVLYGSVQDGPINNLIVSMFSDLNPPMIGQMQRLMQNTGAVFMGDRNVWDGLTNSIGALRQINTVYRRVYRN